MSKHTGANTAPRSRRVVCKFPSVKLGRTVHVGSLLVRDLLYLLDFDPQVESYTETTPHIGYIYSNKRLVFTFDLLIKRDGVVQLAKAVSNNKPFDTQDQLYRSVGFACRRAGYEFVIFTEEHIRAQPRLNNLKILTRYARLRIEPQHRLAYHRFFLSTQSMRVGELMAFFRAEGLEPQVIWTMVYHGLIAVDLSVPFTPETIVRPPHDTVARKVS